MTEFQKSWMSLAIIVMLMFPLLLLAKLAKIDTSVLGPNYWAIFIPVYYFSIKITDVYNAIVYQAYLGPKKP